MRLLFVAEAPPSVLERYFYFEDVRDQDSLFRYVVRTLLDVEPTRDAKAALLSALRDRGVFLIDLKTDPKLGNEPLDRYVEDLVKRATALAPEHVITIKVNVCDLCQRRCAPPASMSSMSACPSPAAASSSASLKSCAGPSPSAGANRVTLGNALSPG